MKGVRHRLFCFLFIAIVCQTEFLLGQFSNLGNPPILSYSKNDTKAGTQTWGIAEDKFGFTWFANNSGLIKFDGYRWDIYPVPNNTIVRSVACDDKDHKIYVGSQGEFGYFAPDKTGEFHYTSISAQLGPKDKKIEDVWQIAIAHEGVFFRTNQQIFRYFNGKVMPIFPQPKGIRFLGLIGQKVMIHTDDLGLYIFDKTRFIPLPNIHKFNLGQITGVINMGLDSIFIATLRNGLFILTKDEIKPWKTNDDGFIKKSTIYAASHTPDKKIILGTTYSGFIVVDNTGKIIYNIDKKSGLQNNAVLSVCGTRTGNVWLGLDNGIDMIHMQSPFHTYYPDGFLQSTGYVSCFHQNRVFFGTNTGLFTLPWKNFYTTSEKLKATFVPGSSGQVWNLQVLGQTLWMGHHDGSFTVTASGVARHSDIIGAWKYLPLENNFILTGNYQGLAVLDPQKNWNQAKKILGFSESARIMYNDKAGNLWISHPYRGIYVVKANEIKQGQTKEVLFQPSTPSRSPLNNNIFCVNKDIIVTDNQQIFKVNPIDFVLSPHTVLNQYIKASENIKFLLEDQHQNLWYGTSKESGLLIPVDIYKTKYTKYIINELNERLVEGFQSVLNINKSNVLFPTEKGFLLFNPDQYIYDTTKLSLFLSKIVLNAKGDSLLYSGTVFNQNQLPVVNLDYDQRHVSFLYSVKDQPNKNFIEYSYQLGDQAKWSDWNKSSELHFNDLAPGRYDLSMKARNQNGIESNIITIEMTIAPQWYRSTFAFIIYTLLLMVGIFWLIRRQQKQHEEEKKKAEYESLQREKELQLDAQLNREEVIRLQNEKLQRELDFKNQELASFTYHLVTKNELIQEIKKTIDHLAPKIENDKELKKEIKNIIQLTEKNANMDEDWDNFMQSFDQVHSGFFKRLHEQFKDLSPNDYKMCTCLRMNMTSKEIAAFMNISIRSVETNRYRLRKKLGLNKEENLTQFIMNY